MKTKAYGFEMGMIVTNKILVHDENYKPIPANSRLRIVAFSPKVFTTPKNLVDNVKLDSKEYFVNLVRAEQENDYSNRIRVHFCMISKSR